MARSEEHNSSTSTSSNEYLQRYGVRDWLHAIMAELGTDLYRGDEHQRYAEWWNADGTAYYEMNQTDEIYPDGNGQPYTSYYVVVYANPDASTHEGFRYDTDTRGARKYDTQWRALQDGQTPGQHEAELLGHLQTAPLQVPPHELPLAPTSVDDTINDMESEWFGRAYRAGRFIRQLFESAD